MCSLCFCFVFEGTVLSHDVHKELTGVAHGVLERLAAGGELRGNGRQLSPRRRSGGRAAAHRGFGGEAS